MLEVAEVLDPGGIGIPLLGQANLWIEDSLDQRSSPEFTQWVVQEALDRTHPGQLEVIVFDDALSGLSAPFESLNAGGEKLLRTINDQQEFKDVLGFLRNHVHGVKRVLQGMSSTLVTFRREVNYPVEGYKLVVLSTDVSFLDEDTQNQLSILLKAGPTAGVSFVIHSTSLGVNPFLIRLCDRYEVKNGVIKADGQAVGMVRRATPVSMIETANMIAEAMTSVQMQPIAFASVQPTRDTWTGSSADGITFAIGRYGLTNVEVTLGDELNQRHNMLVTGAVGQGKSNLLSVMIHSLCQRYSPSELELYLLDFKEGVTLQQFFNGKSGVYLPHARVLGLEADREFALSVFRHLFGIYRDRMRKFKAGGVQNVKQYRAAHPQEHLPRILVMIDEFQMMFAEQDRISDEIAELLVRAVRLFRACGIHIVLASQTIGGNLSLMGSSGEGLFGQVPVRIALKNSLAESHASLGFRNDAAAHLRAREAIVNLDYGAVSSNRKTSLAFADEQVLASLRHGWWLRVKDQNRPPFVFDGESRRALADDAPRLLEVAQSPGGSPSLLLGARIEVGSRPMEIPFGRETGRNLAILGGGGSILELESIALSLAAQPAAGKGARFVVLDLHDADEVWIDSRARFVRSIEAYGCSCELVDRSQVSACLIREAGALKSGAETPADTFILGVGLDRCRDLPTEFQDICRIGPALGTHVLGWWLKLDSFREHVGYGGEAYFDTKIAMRLDAQSAKQFFGDPLLEWRSADNRALVWDSVELTETVRIIPYSRLAS